MAEKVRLSLQLAPELDRMLEKIVTETGSTKTEVFRQALALMKVAHDAKRQGQHIGLVADRSRLDTEIIGLL
jgi:predicted transcriptional regulator